MDQHEGNELSNIRTIVSGKQPLLRPLTARQLLPKDELAAYVDTTPEPVYTPNEPEDAPASTKRRSRRSRLVERTDVEPNTAAPDVAAPTAAAPMASAHDTAVYPPVYTAPAAAPRVAAPSHSTDAAAPNEAAPYGAYPPQPCYVMPYYPPQGQALQPEQPSMFNGQPVYMVMPCPDGQGALPPYAVPAPGYPPFPAFPAPVQNVAAPLASAPAVSSEPRRSVTPSGNTLTDKADFAASSFSPAAPPPSPAQPKAAQADPPEAVIEQAAQLKAILAEAEASQAVPASPAQAAPIQAPPVQDTSAAPGAFTPKVNPWLAPKPQSSSADAAPTQAAPIVPTTTKVNPFALPEDDDSAEDAVPTESMAEPVTISFSELQNLPARRRSWPLIIVVCLIVLVAAGVVVWQSGYFRTSQIGISVFAPATQEPSVTMTPADKAIVQSFAASVTEGEVPVEVSFLVTTDSSAMYIGLIDDSGKSIDAAVTREEVGNVYQWSLMATFDKPYQGSIHAYYAQQDNFLVDGGASVTVNFQ